MPPRRPRLRRRLLREADAGRELHARLGEFVVEALDEVGDDRQAVLEACHANRHGRRDALGTERSEGAGGLEVVDGARVLARTSRATLTATRRTSSRSLP